MEQRSQRVTSQKFTMVNVAEEEARWKAMVAVNELRVIKKFFEKDRVHLAYDKAEKNAWILRTLRDKKQLSKLDKNPVVVLVGSGMYPYSMFDLHKRNPEIKQIGIEIDSSRAKISKKLIEASPAKEAIKIECMDALEYDYSNLTMDDLIFVSVDVDHASIISKVINTSAAQVMICAPYDKTWLKNLVSSIKSF